MNQHILSVAELAALQPPTKFGGWTVDRHSQCYEFAQYQYRVDFARCDNPLKLLEWLWKLHAKDWGRESLDDFIGAVKSVHPRLKSSLSDPPGSLESPARQS